MCVRKSLFIVPLLTFAFHCAPSHAEATTSAPTVLFSDNFEVAEGSVNYDIVSNITHTDGRTGGELGGSEGSGIVYNFLKKVGGSNVGSSDVVVGDGGTIGHTLGHLTGTVLESGDIKDNALMIGDGKLSFSLGLDPASNGQVTVSDTYYGAYEFERGIRFTTRNDAYGDVDYNWKAKLGNHYRIKFTSLSGFNNSLGFSITDVAREGNGDAGKYSDYKFGAYTHGKKWHVGQNGDIVSLGSGIYNDGRAGAHFDFEIEVQEEAHAGGTILANAIVKINFVGSDELALSKENYSFIFDNNTDRYFQFMGENAYGGYLDNLEISTYAIPEFNSFTLLTALLLVSGILVIRRKPQISVYH